SGYFVLELGHFVLESGHFLFELGHFLLESGHFLFEFGHFVFELRHFVLESGHFLFELGHFLSHEKQEERLDYLEKEIRIRNVVFFGISDEEKSYFELEEVILKIITEKLLVECDKTEVQHVRRIGNKGTSLYVKEDYPPKVLQERKNLQEQLKTEIEGGKKAFIKYNKLVVKERKKERKQNYP
ncbi:Endonuclease-reverse transcriptase, partial [Operophtera brumata]